MKCLATSLADAPNVRIPTSCQGMRGTAPLSTESITKEVKESEQWHQNINFNTSKWEAPYCFDCKKAPDTGIAVCTGKFVTLGEQGWRSCESTRLPPVWPGFESWRRRHMWVEFVVGSLLCSERFFSGYSGFPFSLKASISKFQFKLERTDTFQRVLKNYIILSNMTYVNKRARWVQQGYVFVSVLFEKSHFCLKWS